MDRKVVFSALILGLWLGYLVSMLPIVQADLTLDTNCTNGIYTELLHNGSSILFNNTFTCSDGCAYNGVECNSPATPELFFAFAIAFSIAAFTFAYIAFRLDESYRPLQIMFLVFSIMYIALDIYIVSGFATLTMNSLNDVIIGGYILGIWTVIGTVFYFMYLLVRRMLEMLRIKRKIGRPFKW